MASSVLSSWPDESSRAARREVRAKHVEVDALERAAERHWREIRSLLPKLQRFAEEADLSPEHRREQCRIVERIQRLRRRTEIYRAVLRREAGEVDASEV